MSLNAVCASLSLIGSPVHAAGSSFLCTDSLAETVGGMPHIRCRDALAIGDGSLSSDDRPGLSADASRSSSLFQGKMNAN